MYNYIYLHMYTHVCINTYQHFDMTQLLSLHTVVFIIMYI